MKWLKELEGNGYDVVGGTVRRRVGYKVIDVKLIKWLKELEGSGMYGVVAGTVWGDEYNDDWREIN